MLYSLFYTNLPCDADELPTLWIYKTKHTPKDMTSLTASTAAPSGVSVELHIEKEKELFL